MSGDGAWTIPLSREDVRISPATPSLHPHLEVHINTSLPSPVQPGPCAVHLHLLFPDSVFIDRDELMDSWSARGTKDILQWTLDPEVIDIERPVRQHAPDVDLGLILASNSGSSSVTVPLHARYLAPRAEGYETLRVVEPGRVKGGIVCRGDSREVMLASRDLSEVMVEPLSLTLPTGKVAHRPYVELGTTGAIWLGFAWLVYKVLRLGRRLDARAGSKIKNS